MLTVSRIEELIKWNTAQRSEWFENNYNDSISDPYEREIHRLKIMKVFAEAGLQFDLDASGGTALVEGKFVYALRSKKWRVKGKAVWYRTRSAKDFVKLVQKEMSSAF